MQLLVTTCPGPVSLRVPAGHQLGLETQRVPIGQIYSFNYSACFAGTRKPRGAEEQQPPASLQLAQIQQRKLYAGPVSRNMSAAQFLDDLARSAPDPDCLPQELMAADTLHQC